jgi:hypothetical protein
MSFAALQSQYFNSRQKKTAVVFTGIIILILVTPLCGFLFDCGCTWPWSGLDQDVTFISTILLINAPGVLHGLLVGYQLECLLLRPCL